MIALAIIGLIIILGGIKVIGYTDVLQVGVLIIGGLVTTYLALTKVSESFGLGHRNLSRNILAFPQYKFAECNCRYYLQYVAGRNREGGRKGQYASNGRRMVRRMNEGCKL